MPGRGKPKGLPKRGGRQKGAVDKIKREAILAAQGITPLDYMMMLVRAETPALILLSLALARPYAYWGPWLDRTHPNPAKPGELRWFTTINGEDREVDGPGPHMIDGQPVMARSRTFI